MTKPTPTSPPEPPYYAVIFTSVRTAGDHGYDQRAEEMLDLAAQQPGFLGVDSSRGADGFGITVSYWTDEQSIAAWRDHATHAATRAQTEQGHQAGGSVGEHGDSPDCRAGLLR
ncbi:antibiotic biosynthesis monooxygenase [Micromonospora sp. NPDC050200]|uniref:antibiotic biosynthesis monooxygenase family protein n=1 Tax=Micromonospora sp. NPDC050200 TaxID=3155664 RepID=UPI0033CDEA92